MVWVYLGQITLRYSVSCCCWNCELQHTFTLFSKILDIRVTLCLEISLIPVLGQLFSSGHFPVPSIPCWVTLKRTFRLAPRSHLSGLQSHDRNAGSGIVMVGDERSQGCRKNVTSFSGSQQRCHVFSIRPCCETYTGGGLLRKLLDLLQVVSYLFLQHFLRQIHVQRCEKFGPTSQCFNMCSVVV